MNLKKAKKLLDELPKDVLEDRYYEKEFLSLLARVVADHGEDWVKEHREMLLSQWEYVRTLV